MLQQPSAMPGYEVPLHRSLTEAILIAGAPRNFVILNGTLSAAIGLGLRLHCVPGLIVNAVVLWNTIYTDAALNRLRQEGFKVLDEDVARLSPLGHDHINMPDRHAFTLPARVARGERHPLRDPNQLVDEAA